MHAINSSIILLNILFLFLTTLCIFALIYFSFTGHKILLDQAQGLYIDSAGHEDIISEIIGNPIFSMIVKSYLFSLIVGVAPKAFFGTRLLFAVLVLLVYLGFLTLLLFISLFLLKHKKRSLLLITFITICSLPLFLGVLTAVIPMSLIFLTFRLFKNMSYKPKPTFT
ncbi:hypothetical protein [Macrococcus brunensis]|uniref:hypothetical protein n=1 Tax=Macrococcus brunensis TaxID=198483 RepID=UPI001EF024EC|nr:hypothetical protein [Macrococcus brunensis]ULG72415.1 hypothetical protein MGG12_02530 [Macrococcus brunensis]